MELLIAFFLVFLSAWDGRGNKGRKGHAYSQFRCDAYAPSLL